MVQNLLLRDAVELNLLHSDLPDLSVFALELESHGCRLWCILQLDEAILIPVILVPCEIE